MRISLNILYALILLAAGFIAFAALRPALAQDAEVAPEEAATDTADATTEFTPFLSARGESARAIGENLETQGLIDSAFFFRMSLRFSGEAANIQAGEYAIPLGASMEEIVEIITSGDVIQRNVTFPEGLTSWQMVQVLNKVEELPGEITEIPVEGTLLPETYAYTAGDTKQDILDRAAVAMTKALEELWVNRSADVAVDTIEEAVILASIIEKETGVNSERHLVSSVYSNRLTTRGWRLQADPTIIYGLTDGRMDLGRGLRKSELKDASNLYNTYQHNGLPPGPIANPGKAALEAAMNPADTDFFFFVADCEGGHNFGVTLDDHNRNVAYFRRTCG